MLYMLEFKLPVSTTVASTKFTLRMYDFGVGATAEVILRPGAKEIALRTYDIEIVKEIITLADASGVKITKAERCSPVAFDPHSLFEKE